MKLSGVVPIRRWASLLLSVMLLCLLPLASSHDMSFAAQTQAMLPSGQIEPGRWVGTLVLRQTQQSRGEQSQFSFDLVIKILTDDRGILVDIPDQGLFSYPIDRYSIDADRISLVFDAMGAEEELSLTGNFSSSFVPRDGNRKGGIVGTVRGRSWSGSFSVQKEMTAPPQGDFHRSSRRGCVPPSNPYLPVRSRAALEVDAPANFPLVILVAGAGKTDRDGNNVDVPGKTNSLRQLAEMLRERNVGTLRYDRRGTGEAYKLEVPGIMTSFSQHVVDLAAVIRAAAALPRQGRLIVAGMNEGAWMAMAALNALGEEASVVDGLVVLDASGESPMESLRQSLEGLDWQSREKALEAAKTLVDSGTLIEVPEHLATFFSPGRKDWLATWLAFDPVAALKKVTTPVLLVYGEHDMQVSKAAFAKLASAKPQAGIRVVPGMNYVLKEVHSEDENYASFTDPTFKVPALLADLLASYAKAQPGPEGLMPFTSGLEQLQGSSQGHL